MAGPKEINAEPIASLPDAGAVVTANLHREQTVRRHVLLLEDDAMIGASVRPGLRVSVSFPLA